MARYHPSDEWLALYATGSLDEHIEVLIASHLIYCPLCREAVARHEEIAGALLDLGLEDGEDRHDDFDAVLKKARSTVEGRRKPAPAGTLSRIAPRTLSDYVYDLTGQTDLDSFAWSDHLPGIKRLILVGDADNPIARLVEAQPGAEFQRHSHDSDELALVLTGAYRDESGRYETGDVQSAEAGVSHQPIVEDGDVCYVLIVSEKPD